jgi:hypothetical protein
MAKSQAIFMTTALHWSAQETNRRMGTPQRTEKTGGTGDGMTSVAVDMDALTGNGLLRRYRIL